MSTREQVEQAGLVADEHGYAEMYTARRHFILGYLVGADAHRPTEPDTEWEYGVEYEVDSAHSEFTPAHSLRMAEEWVADSPTDTGLRRRRPAGPWLPVTPKGEGT